jgi:hypothetical protein
MMTNLPKIKGMPDDLMARLKQRQEKHQKIADEHSKVKLEYLCAKIKSEILLDLTLTKDDRELPAELIIDKASWTRQVQQDLLNGSENNKLKSEMVSFLESVMLEKLTEQSNNLMRHWQASNSALIHNKQLPILIQTDLEAIGSNAETIDFKELKHESRRKETLQNHCQVTKNLIENHALGHVATLSKLNIEHLAAKKRNYILKANCKEYEAMLKTYTPEANKALLKMHQDFEKKIQLEEKKLAQMQGEVERYKQLGSDIDNIAEKYAKVLQEIKHNEWMLQEIQGNDA